MSISDDFNRADDTSLGANWTDITAGMRVVSNTARSETAGVYNWATYTASSWNASQSSQITIVSGYGDCGVLCNAGDAAGGGDGYMAMATSGGNRRIYRRDNGSFTLLNSSDGAALSAGDTLKLDNAGGTLSYIINGGAATFTTSDSTYTTGLAPGVYNVGDTTVPGVDNWIGTGESAGGGRTTKNTRGYPLGMEIGMNWRGTAGS